MGIHHTDLNEAFEDYNQELEHSVHLYLPVEYFDGLIHALIGHCYYLCVIQFHRHGFLEVDRMMMVLVGCVVLVEFHNVVFVPHTEPSRHVVVDQQQQLELAISLVGSYIIEEKMKTTNYAWEHLYTCFRMRQLDGICRRWQKLCLLLLMFQLANIAKEEN